MVDKIKFIVDNANLNKTILEEKFFESKFPSQNGNRTYVFRNNVIEDDAESDDDSENANDKKYRKYLYIKYIVYKTPKRLPNVDYIITNELIIHRNLRKDWLGEGRLADLGYKSFVKAINKYAHLFGVGEAKFWNARVTKVELGLTLRLNSNMRGILSCLDSFNGITEKNIYGSNGIGFIGENFSISIYDKIERMINNNEIVAKNKKNLIEKVLKNNYFLRFELKVEKVSGFYRSDFRNRINFLREIRDNWDKLGEAVLNLYYDINYIDVLSPEVQETISGKATTEMSKFLVYTAIQSIGKDNFY